MNNPFADSALPLELRIAVTNNALLAVGARAVHEANKIRMIRAKHEGNQDYPSIWEEARSSEIAMVQANADLSSAILALVGAMTER